MPPCHVRCLARRRPARPQETPIAEQQSEHAPASTAPIAAIALIALIAPLIGIYVVSQFLRNSTGVIAPDIARELSLGAAQLGVLSSAFFFSFAAAQIPVGAVIDRFGAKSALLGSLGLAVAGSVLFGCAETLAGLTLARVLMGLGCSTFYVAPLSIYARTFAPRRFAGLVALQLGLGSVGTLLATAPLGHAAATIGWRVSFWLVAAIVVAIGLVVALTVPRAPASGDAAPRSIAHSFSGFRDVFATPGVWPLFAIHLVSYGAFVSIIGLWGGPFLADVHGLGTEDRGDMLLAMAAAQVLGVLGWGAMDRHFTSRKRPVLVGAALTVATLLALAAFPTLPLPGLAVLLALLGVASAYSPIMVAHGKELFAPHLVGRGITLLNIGTMGGVVVLQMATAFVIGWFDQAQSIGPHPLSAYRWMFVSLAASLAAALAYYATAPEGRRRT